MNGRGERKELSEPSAAGSRLRWATNSGHFQNYFMPNSFLLYVHTGHLKWTSFTSLYPHCLASLTSVQRYISTPPSPSWPVLDSRSCMWTPSSGCTSSPCEEGTYESSVKNQLRSTLKWVWSDLLQTYPPIERASPREAKPVSHEADGYLRPSMAAM